MTATTEIPNHLIGELTRKELAFYQTLRSLKTVHENTSKPDLINQLIDLTGSGKASVYRWIHRFEELGIITFKETTTIEWAED